MLEEREVCWGSRRRRRAALGEAAQGVDSYRHGAGKHQAERWSCFNEDASMTQASKGLVLYYFIFP